jgi:hypothetical protein
MAVGYIYVLTNPAMPSMVKVGYTHENTAVRARQIFTTGVPKPFQIEFFFLTENVEAVEAAVHKALHPKRVSNGREFFSVEIAEAVREIERHVREPEPRFLREPLKPLPFKSNIDPPLRACRRCGFPKESGNEHLFCPKCGF